MLSNNSIVKKLIWAINIKIITLLNFSLMISIFELNSVVKSERKAWER